MLELSKTNDPILRKRCKDIERPSARDKKFLDDMLETMYAYQGVGLAAPQVGSTKRMIVVDAGEGPLRLINPRIVKRSGRTEVMEEGCLSLPKISVKVKRKTGVIVSALDENGKQMTCAANGLLARVLQHEIDHLDGKLIIDYLSLPGRIGLKIRSRPERRS